MWQVPQSGVPVGMHPDGTRSEAELGPVSNVGRCPNPACRLECTLTGHEAKRSWGPSAMWQVPQSGVPVGSRLPSQAAGGADPTIDYVSSIEIVARSGHPDFLDLPWDDRLEEWSDDRLVNVARGVSRHVVRFLRYPSGIYAIKETGAERAQFEYDLLRKIADRGLPVVEAIAVVSGRSTTDTGALITKHLSFSLPYRYLFQAAVVEDLSQKLLDALSLLLVRLHLDGIFWGDCSLSNTLFRRDAGALAAYLVDAETATIGDTRLSDGQRRHDIELAAENLGGEMLDLSAGGRLDALLDPLEIGDDLRGRYDRLWQQLVGEEVFDLGSRHRLEARTRRLNELGFDIDEYRTRITPDGSHIRIVPRVVEQGHHRRRLQQLTGLDVDENQARRLLNNIDEYRADVERTRSNSLPEALVAYEWLTRVYRPTLQTLPEELLVRLPEAEVFHQILEHRWYKSEEVGHDIGLEAATESYANEVLSRQPQEQAILPDPTDPEAFESI
jgi:hypothetical protein